MFVEDLHNQPISKMGNYQEYMACLSNIGAGPLRELEPQAARPHAFGNPFKLDKKSMAIDEVLLFKIKKLICVCVFRLAK